MFCPNVFTELFRPPDFELEWLHFPRNHSTVTGDLSFHRNHTSFHETFLGNWYFLECFAECISARLFSTGTVFSPPECFWPGKLRQGHARDQLYSFIEWIWLKLAGIGMGKDWPLRINEPWSLDTHFSSKNIFYNNPRHSGKDDECTRKFFCRFYIGTRGFRLCTPILESSENTGNDAPRHHNIKYLTHCLGNHFNHLNHLKNIVTTVYMCTTCYVGPSDRIHAKWYNGPIMNMNINFEIYYSEVAKKYTFKMKIIHHGWRKFCNLLL